MSTSNQFMIDEIAQIRSKSPSMGGGLSYWWMYMWGGEQIEIHRYHPHIAAFRGRYYYNSYENALYEKLAYWVAVDSDIECVDADYVEASTGRRVQVLLNPPDPHNYGDNYYYHLGWQQLYKRRFEWRNLTTHSYDDPQLFREAECPKNSIESTRTQDHCVVSKMVSEDYGDDINDRLLISNDPRRGSPTKDTGTPLVNTDDKTWISAWIWP